ncbi:vitellogenin 1-like, partial [Scleropages formosus]
GQQNNLTPDFATGKTYVYQYEALLQGGLPEEGLARAGVKIVSKVLISQVAQTTHLLKLKEPQLFQYTGVWPRDEFSPAAKLTQALAAQFRIPVKFEYVSGVVGKLFAPAEVSETILNIHRGILNILQLNIKKTQNVYELQEAGSQGVCKTDYVISEDTKAERIHVIKSKDLGNCQKRVMADIGMAYTETCVQCQQKNKNLRGAATYSYVMKPTQSGALIMEAAVQELHQFTPFHELTGAAQMKARQLMTFVEAQNDPVQPIQADYLARGSLQYEFASELLQTPIQLIKVTNAQAQIEEILNHLVKNNAGEVHEDAPLKFVELAQLLRMAKYETINKIWAQVKAKPDFRRWFLDTVPAIGTQVALRFIKEKFLAGEVTVIETAQALLAALHLVEANLDTVNLAASVVLNAKTQSHPILREIAMLGYGSLVFKFCTEHQNCPADVIKPIHDFAAEAISKANVAEIALAMKVLGNAGHPASIKPIMKLLPGFGSTAAALPVKVQVDAVVALRHIAKREQRRVQDIALQLFLDRDLHPELRMAACVVLFKTKPSIGLVSTIAAALQKEKSLQVASFTYSHMKALTRSTAPDLAQVAAACNVAIKILSPKFDRLSYRFSKAIHLDFFHNRLMAGAATTAYFINDAATILPRAVVAKVRAYMVGAAADVFEIGVRTEGIQEALMKERAADAGADRISRMRRILNALTNWKPLPTSQPLGSVYLKLFGQEIAFANIDKDIIERAIQLATGAAAQHELWKTVLNTLQSGADFQISKSLLTSEVRRIFPTSVGFPMELSLYSAAVAAATVKAKATLTPPPRENFQLAQLKNTDIQLQAHIAPSIAVHKIAVMGVNTAIIQAAIVAKAKVHNVLPLKFNARVHIAQGHFKIEALPLQAHGRLLDLQMDKKWCVTMANLGQQACAKITSQNAGFVRNSPLYKLIGEYSVTLDVKPVSDEAVEKIEIELQVGQNAASKIIKRITIKDDNTDKGNRGGTPVVLKLKKILETERSRFLGDSVPPGAVVIIRAVRGNDKRQGYQIAAYMDKADVRVQVIMAALAENDNWKMCADGIQLSMHKVMAKIRWGEECQDYATVIQAETGLLGSHPAVQMKLNWKKTPRAVKRYARMISEYIPGAALMAGFSEGRHRNSKRQIKLTVASTSARTLSVILKTPRMTMYKLAQAIPIALPFGAAAARAEVEQNIANRIYYMFAEANTAKCIVADDTVTTFNNRRYSPEVPSSCHQVLAQDCTTELKFVVLMKKDETSEKPHIIVKVAQISNSCHTLFYLMLLSVSFSDVDWSADDNGLHMKVNGMDVPTVKLPYEHSTGSIIIRQNGDGLSLYAPGQGLHEVYYDGNILRIEVEDWMKGKVCGLCGKADGEVRQEYQAPSGRQIMSAVSFGHSWVLAAESCRDASECRLRQESVMLDKPVTLHGQASKCYSTEPVLQCLPECKPVKTTPVTVGFHCVPA